jgi:hypothetical protein
VCWAALDRAGIEIADEREVLVDVDDRPMALGELPGSSRAANLNVGLACSTFGGVKIVIAIDDPESARAALQWRHAYAEGPTRCRLRAYQEDRSQAVASLAPLLPFPGNQGHSRVPRVRRRFWQRLGSVLPRESVTVLPNFPGSGTGPGRLGSGAPTGRRHS